MLIIEIGNESGAVEIHGDSDGLRRFAQQLLEVAVAGVEWQGALVTDDGVISVAIWRDEPEA